MTEIPKIFISYSWTTPKHEDWVINLAERLVSDGIDVVIDKWDLKEGQDKFTFMESMVNSTEIAKVLIILDKKYTDKADQRTGGVGTETQIISPKIYANVSQEKFIPIVTERDEEGNAFIPTFLEGRIYIDFSELQQFETRYEDLLRNIYKRPAYSKPKLGKAPTYLFEETLMNHKTSSILRSFDNQIEKNPKRINSILREFLDEFYSNLKQYSINFTTRDEIGIGKEICDNINSYTPLRNDFIFFIDKLIKTEIEFDIEILIHFLEKFPLLTLPQDNRNSYSKFEFDNFRFFIHELFLYVVAIGLKNENYKFVEEILYSSYFFKDNHQNEPKRYEKLYQYIEIIKPYYNQTYSKDFFSPMADLMIKRIPNEISKDNFIDADLVCFYVAKLNMLRWFPITYIYRAVERFELFDRLISMRHFEKLKILFSVQNIQQLKDKLLEIQVNDKIPEITKYSDAFEGPLPIYKIINIEKLGTAR